MGLPKFDMSERAIVRRVDRNGSQRTFDAPFFKKVREGERLQFDAHVNVELIPDADYLKRATLFSNVPNGGTWEFVSDEGTAIGGNGLAPSPLMYLTVGIGFCLMSHVEIISKQLDIRLDRVVLEQKTSYSTTWTLGAMHPRDIFGSGEKNEMHLVIDSPEPKERLEEFTSWVQQACMALQTVARETPSVTELYLNGERIGEVGQRAPA